MTNRCLAPKCRRFLAAAALLFPVPATAAVVTVSSTTAGWRLFVDGEPYVVRGVAYTPVKVGEDPATATLRDWMLIDDDANGRNDPAYDSFVDANNNDRRDANEPVQGDFRLLRKMGANTIRLYHHASNDPSVQAGYGDANQNLQYNHPPNKDLLRDLHQTYGIRVAMGDFAGAQTIGSGAAFVDGTDYTDATQKNRIKASVRQMVLDFKDEDFILFWVLGNENNAAFSISRTNAAANIVAYMQFIEELAQEIKSLDTNHPVAICGTDVTHLQEFVDNAPSVDIFGTNAYRDLGFDTMWTEIAAIWNGPVVILEYGQLRQNFTGSNMDLARQAQYHQANWLDIERNLAGGAGTGQALGGVAFAWLDDWAQNGNGSVHDIIGSGAVNNEWHGVASQGDGSGSLFVRRLRPVYFTYQSLWPAPESPSDTVAVARAYPNPARPDLGHTEMVIDRLPEGARVRVYTLRGEFIRELDAGFLGEARWDLKNESGRLVASGVYLVLAQGVGGTERLKVAVER